MNTQTASPWIYKITRSIPEIWYIAILSVITFSFIYDAIGREWQDSSMLFSLLLVSCIGLLVKQIFQRRNWISIILGIIFGAVSLFMLGALFSEYSEFPDKTVSNAVQLIIGGGLLIGTSLILAVAMWLRGILKP